MEFNVLPRAKILSPASNHKTTQTNNQTVNVIIPPPKPKPIQEPIAESNTETETIHEEISDGNPYKALDDPAIGSLAACDVCRVNYTQRDVKLDEPADTLTAEDSIATINFLKLVLQAYMNNPIKYNGYIICSLPTLENLIETLTSCDDADVQVADIETGCCGGSSPKIIPVSKIWVKNGDTTQPFKLRYPQFLAVFEQYHISLKFVFA